MRLNAEAVGVTHMDTLSVAGIVRDILKDRSCRRLGTAVSVSKYHRAMVTDRMLIDAARQLARQASDNPLDFRYGLCVFGLMPAQPAPGVALREFVRMCKAFSVAQDVLEEKSYCIIRLITIRDSAAYSRARDLYQAVRAPNPLVTIFRVQWGLRRIITSSLYVLGREEPGYHEAQEVNEQGVLGPYNATGPLSPADHHRIEFLRHVFYMTLSTKWEYEKYENNNGKQDMDIYELNDAINHASNTCNVLYQNGTHTPVRSELVLAILRRVPQLYSQLEDDSWTDSFRTKALQVVVKAHGEPVDPSPFSLRFAQGVRIAELYNATFMRSRSSTDFMASTWSESLTEDGSYVEDMVRILTKPKLKQILNTFPQVLAAVTQPHIDVWEDEWIDKLKSVISEKPELQQYIFDEDVRARLGL